MKKKVYLRAYICSNLGDDLFIEILLNRYPNVLFLADSYSLPPQLNSDRISSIYSISDKLMMKLLRQFDRFFLTNKTNKYLEIVKHKNLDLCDYVVYLIGSGFIENDSRIDDEYFYSKHPYIIGCNFGPYNTENFKNLCESLFCNASDICFRDKKSYELFSHLPNTRNEMDIVFSYPITNVGERKRNNYIVISIMDIRKDSRASEFYEEYIKFICNCIRYYHKKGKQIVLAGFCKREHDDLAIKDTLEKCQIDNVESVIYPEISIDDMVNLIAYADEVIASRYHAMVLAMLFRRKVYTIVYNEKTKNVLNDIDKDILSISVDRLSEINFDLFISNYGYTISEDILNKVVKSAERQFAKIDSVLR